MQYKLYIYIYNARAEGTPRTDSDEAFIPYKMVEGEAASNTYSCGYFFKNNLASLTKHSSKVLHVYRGDVRSIHGVSQVGTNSIILSYLLRCK